MTIKVLQCYHPFNCNWRTQKLNRSSLKLGLKGTFNLELKYVAVRAGLNLGSAPLERSETWARKTDKIWVHKTFRKLFDKLFEYCSTNCLNIVRQNVRKLFDKLFEYCSTKCSKIVHFARKIVHNYLKNCKEIVSITVHNLFIFCSKMVQIIRKWFILFEK